MATIPASDNEFPKLYLSEVAAPSTPASGLIVAYAKAGGVYAWKDDGGTEHIVGEAAPDAADVVFDPTGLSNVTGTEVQTAIEELDAAIAGGGISPTIIAAKGDIIGGSANDTPAIISAGANGTVPTYDSGAAAGVAAKYPPGYEMTRTAITGNVSINQSAQASAVTVATLGAITGDGTYTVDIELSLAGVSVPATVGHNTIFYLYDGSAFMGIIGYIRNVAANGGIWPVRHSVRITPPASSVTYVIRATASSGTATVNAGTGGTGAGDFMPSFARILRMT